MCLIFCDVTFLLFIGTAVIYVILNIFLLFEAKARQNNIKNSVHILKETQHFSIKKFSCLMLFKGAAVVCCENYKKHINKLCEQKARVIES
jgi:thioredoxin-related protein